MDNFRLARNVSRLLVTSGLALIVTVAAGCQQSPTEEKRKGVTIETDRESGALNIDVNVDGKKIEVDAGKDGADVRLETKDKSSKDTDTPK